MTNPLQPSPLSDAELDRLGEILKARGGDNGLNVEGIDGLFAALVCSPILAKPSEWLPIVWGGEAPRWNSVAEFQEVFGLLMRHWNHVASTINNGSYAPLMSQGTNAKGDVVAFAHYWCLGFDVGMRFCEELWFDDSDRVLVRLLAPITFLRADILRAVQGASKQRLSRKEQDEYMDQIPMTVVLLRQYWLKRRPPEAAADAAVNPSIPPRAQVGRNEPCPCGSGKKYKHCHGSGGVH